MTPAHKIVRLYEGAAPGSEQMCFETGLPI